MSRMTPRRLAACLFIGLVGLASGCAVPGPNVVLEQAVSAAHDGDREAFLECFTPRSRAILETWWRATDAHNPPLGALAAADVRITSIRLVPSRDFEPERAVLAIEEGPDATRIVAHRLGGMWRLDILDSQRSDTGGPGER